MAWFTGSSQATDPQMLAIFSEGLREINRKLDDNKRDQEAQYREDRREREAESKELFNEIAGIHSTLNKYADQLNHQEQHTDELQEDVASLDRRVTSIETERKEEKLVSDSRWSGPKRAAAIAAIVAGGLISISVIASFFPAVMEFFSSVPMKMKPPTP